MACFLVPAALGIITTVARKMFPKRLHIDWLNIMLWGAVIMLAVEHLAHGEITVYPPFLTAGFAEVLPEMFAVGVPMTVFSVIGWIGMVAVSEFLLSEKKIKTSLQIRKTLGYV
ncbi:MAG: hypothetical protein DRP13_00285 [Candidatus Aenigmatarchaeota archaeon]|nr:MAG: hypothetical protein DRP13_00285 [Candidatus Aenigmarchaeota archaeon]